MRSDRETLRTGGGAEELAGYSRAVRTGQWISVSGTAPESRGDTHGQTVDASHWPLPSDSPLWDSPKLAISPHSSASADRYLERVGELFYDNLARYVAGEELRNLVDLSHGY